MGAKDPPAALKIRLCNGQAQWSFGSFAPGRKGLTDEREGSLPSGDKPLPTRSSTN